MPFSNHMGARKRYWRKRNLTKDGGFCMVGATESFGNGLTDLYVIKTDENGVVEWHSTFGGPNIDYGKV